MAITVKNNGLLDRLITLCTVNTNTDYKLIKILIYDRGFYYNHIVSTEINFPLFFVFHFKFLDNSRDRRNLCLELVTMQVVYDRW